MGLSLPTVELLFAENKYKSIEGDVGFIGRQTTYATADSIHFLSKKYGFGQKEGFSFELDTVTRSSNVGGGHLITDKALMNYFGSNSFSCIDVSDYEGADIICDLSDDIPEELHNRFDFIYDGSCLDNIFNPATALMNISRLLRPGGRVILVNHATWFNGPYTVFSPGWFFDYFVANRYEDCQVFLGIFSNTDELMYGPMQVYFSNWFINCHGNVPEFTYRVGDSTHFAHVLLFVVAEKGKDSTNDVRPIQMQYRDTTYNETTFKNDAIKIMNSKRRHFSLQSDLSANREQYGFIPLVLLGEGIPR